MRRDDKTWDFAGRFSRRAKAVGTGGAPRTSDVTDLRLTEKELHLVVEEAPVGIVMVDRDGAIRLVNEEAERIFGYDRPDLVGRPIEILLPERFRAKHPSNRVRYLAHPKPLAPGMGRDDLRAVRKDGSEFPSDIGLNRIETAEGPLVMASVIDVTERKQMEAALRESEERFRLVVEGIQESFTLREVVRDSDGTPVDLRYLLVNAAAERQLGRMRADLLGHLESGIRGPLDGETRELIDRTMESPRPILQERHDPVSKRWYMACSYSPRVGQIATLSLDVTERKLFEERILQTQKLESLGVLAGGIAHDFNNILQAILGAAEVAATMLPPGSPVQDNLHGISSSARRASDLTAQMLAYAGQGRYKVQLLDISAEIESMREMLAMVISKKAEVAYELAPALPAVRGDLSQLHQIVVNIMINASESLPNGEGTIRVTTASATVDQASLESSWSAEQLRVGRYVSLEISDTGCGMDEATQARIFDPFFTTKFTGRGLGLAAVLGIVRGHKGAIRVRSEPGKGSTFTVLFPQAEASPMPEAGAGRSRT